MRYILGVDPGKKGAFVLIDEHCAVIKTWDMTYHGATLSAAATAEVYRDVLTITNGTVEIFIEKAFTMPSDALSMEQWREIQGLHEKAKILLSSYLRHKEGQAVAKECFDAQFGAMGFSVEVCKEIVGGKYRPDGRVGSFNYAKAAGVLEICAAFGMTYHLVSPKTWCAEMHKGADGNLKAKDKSAQIIGRRWPELAKKGSPLWRARGRGMDEGLMDAFMIAVYGLGL